MTSPHEDAKRIRKAIEGLGTDDAALVEIITHRTNEQLQFIASEYLAAFKKSIIDDIKGDTSGHYEDLLVGLVEAKPAYIARIIHEAVKGAGTNEGAILDCLLHASNGLIKDAHCAYQQIYSKSIVEDVSGDTSGDFKKVLVALLHGVRADASGVNLEQAKTDAENIYNKGEGRLGTDDEFFIDFFTTRSYQHIYEVNRLYQEKRGHSLAQAVDKEFSGWTRTALKGLAVPGPVYWAERIHSAVARLGTNDSRLLRAFVLNDRAKLQSISEAYSQIYGKGGKTDGGKSYSGVMAQDVKDDTSGWYQKALLSLLA